MSKRCIFSAIVWILPEHYNHIEDKSQKDITYIAPYIVEGRNGPNRMGTFEVVVASILVTTSV